MSVQPIEQQNNISEVELGSSIAKIRARGKFIDKDALDFVPTAESALIHIDTPLYDGPLDLLLHLIRKHSMDIFDIPIVMITKKYLEALEEMSNLNLDIAGEFLVMAATLAEIKSKLLLPKEERVKDEEEETSDPRAELVEKLLLYKSFKQASIELQRKNMLGKNFFLREFEPAVVQHTEEELAPVGIYELVENFSRVLKANTHKSIHTVTSDRISVSGRIKDLLHFCKLKPTFTFYDILRHFPLYEKIDIIINFLALLEMARLKLIKIIIDQDEDLSITINKEFFYIKEKEVLKNINNNLEQNDYE